VPSALAEFSRLPLAFEPNVGQAAPQVRFLARGPGYALSLTDIGAVLSLHTSDAAGGQQSALRMSLVGGNPAAAVEGLGVQAGVSNYLLGSDPSAWHTNVPRYGQVAYRQAYAGIDVIYHGDGQQQLEYDFTVAPGTDPGRIGLRFEGQQGLALDGQGDLVLHTAAGDVVEHAPDAYQDGAGGRVPVAAAYALRGDGTVGFSLGAYDPSLPLVIDPTLVYSTYLGGSISANGGDTVGQAVAVDAACNTYLTGVTESVDFPTAGSPPQPTQGGGSDVFVTKFGPSGALVYSTFLGGSSSDLGRGIAVDGAGDAVVTGYTLSTNFPTTANALQAAFGGGVNNSYSTPSDAFVAKLNPAGSALLYSTYLGGSGNDYGEGVALDVAGNAYVTGWTGSANFPTVNPAVATFAHPDNPFMVHAFVSKVNPAGSALLYSTYLPGGGYSQGYGIAVDGAGSAYVTGTTSPFTDTSGIPSGFGTTPGAFQQTSRGGADAFVTKLNAAGTALVYSTYLGGSSDDSGAGIAVDAGGCAYVVGGTGSTDFPLQAPAQGAIQEPALGHTFVSKLNAAGTALVYSTYLGGSGQDVGHGIAVDGSGYAYVVGETISPDFPTVNPVQATFGDGHDSSGVPAADAFVTKLAASGSTLLYSTYLGGSGVDSGRGIAVDAAHGAAVTGETFSTDFPTAGNPVQATHTGGANAFLARLSGVAETPLVYHAPAGGPHDLELRLNGTVLELRDNGALVLSQALDATSAVLVYGADGAADSLTVRNDTGGLIVLPGGINFDGGAGGGNRLSLIGTAFRGPAYRDTLLLTPTYALLNESQIVRYVNVAEVTANDVPESSAAYLFAGPGAATFTGTDSAARLDEGGLSSTATGFGSVWAFASGAAIASLTGAANAAVFQATPDVAFLQTGPRLLLVSGFGSVHATALAAGGQAALYDSPGDDTFVATPTATSSLAGPGYRDEAEGFAWARAFAQGGADQAYFSDGPGDGLFVGTPAYSYLQSGGLLLVASGFPWVRATSGGADRAVLEGSAGDDAFLGTPSYSSLAGSGYYLLVAGFPEVRAEPNGGNDVANLYDSAGDDLFRGTPAYSFLAGPGYDNLVVGFARVNAYAGSGGSDAAELYDSPGADTFSGQETDALLSGPGYALFASRFGRVQAYATAGGYDRLFLGAIDYIFEQFGAWH
jgi:hypothetical protein